ncbi:MAG: biopolymer transporter ExbD [Proteobacteria bacterium]|nr:biopolymer transporter ExbD [Pseudomonadota bacterium]
MGMNVGGSKKGPKSDINVTPLVDIVLVLLIIFLVITPIKMRHITIEVPRKLQDNEDTTIASRQITVLMRADTTLLISDGRKETDVQSVFELAKALRPMIEKKKTEKVVFVDFEDAVKYGDAVITMDTIKGAGAEKIALKIRDEENKPASGP